MRPATHVINITNVIIEWRPKAASSTPAVREQPQGVLCGNAGNARHRVFDPKVIYDQYKDRFVSRRLSACTAGWQCRASWSRYR